MIPLRITLEGFMSYREKQTLDFDGHALWVLAGANGAGKSAIFDAITFTLYGQYRGGEQHFARLINNQGVRALDVTFEFQVADRTYMVRRTCPRKGSGTWEASERLDGRWERIEGADSVSKSEDWVRRTIGLSYEAFVSSVMLLQGQSERLLKAKPVLRYDILSELIEMAPYQALEKRAEQERNLHESAAKHLDAELQSLPGVSEETLQEAAHAASVSKAASENADKARERWVRIHSGALNHARLSQEKRKRSDELNHDLALLSRAGEIRAGHVRFMQLDAVLGPLQHIDRLRQQTAKDAQELATLEKAVAASVQQNEKLGAELAKKTAMAEGLQAQLSSGKAGLAKVQEQLTTLAPIIERLALIEEREKKLGELNTELARFPADLSQQCEEARRKAELLDKARDALEPLTSLARARGELLDAESDGEKAQQQMDAACRVAEQIAEEETKLRERHEQAQAHQRELVEALGGYRTSCKELDARLKGLAEVAAKRECSLCGQPIDEQHAEKERARLLGQRDALREQITAIKKQQDDVAVSVVLLAGELNELQKRKSQTENAQGEAQAILKRLPKRIEKAKKQLDADLKRLPADHQQRVCPEAGGPARWRETSYPGEEDLLALKEQVDGRSAQGRLLSALDAQHMQWIRMQGQIKENQETLNSLLNKESNEVRVQARAEQAALQKEYGRKLNECQRIEQQHGEAAEAVRMQQEALRAGTRRQEEQERGLLEKRTRIGERKEQQRQWIEQLPVSWQEKGDRMAAAELAQVQSEHAGLRGFVQEQENLVVAEKRQSTVQAQLDELKRQIDAIPPEERAAVADVAAALDGAERERREADEQWRKAQGSLAELERNRAARIRLEQRHQEAAKKHHLYKRLAKLLGREELQRSLMRAAEREIVRLANGILNDLSRGRMQLRLRNEEAAPPSGKGAEKQKALDLEFLNADTGGQWMDTELASGSQCFRIAISLALAIGSYFGRDARRVESVIIDEGFGCLDKANREDTIEVLKALQGTMKRIILVSHQDEFSHEFKNGYEVRLEDRSSQVRRMVV